MALGGITIGGGALFGTGAFSTVQADRTVNVAVEGDSAALLSLDDADSNGNDYGNASNISNGTLELTFDNLGNSTGLNLDATTTFDPLFRAINNGSSSIDLYVNSSDADGSVGSASILSSGQVLKNTITDTTNSTTVDLEYQFQDESGNSIVDTDGSTASVTLDATGGADPNHEISLAIGVSAPSGSPFNPSNVQASDYLEFITLNADAV